MKIRKTVAAVGLAGVLGITGVGALVLGPQIAMAATAAEEDGTAEGFLAERLQAIKDALAGLVSDGTITQQQADRVAETLNESDALRHGPGGPGHRLLDFDAAAEALDMTAEELRRALATEGTTLADVAEDQGVESSALVDALVAAATERIEQAVTDGRLTQEQADDLTEALPDRIAEAIERPLGAGGHHGRGHGFGPGRGDPDDADQPESGESSDGSTAEPSAATGASFSLA